MIPASHIPSEPEPLAPGTFKLPSVRLVDLKSQLPPKDWPHAPLHRLADNAVYFVTAGTLHKQHLFDTPEKRDLLERHLPPCQRMRLATRSVRRVCQSLSHCGARQSRFAESRRIPPRSARRLLA